MSSPVAIRRARVRPRRCVRPLSRPPAMWSLLREFMQFLREEKKWWLLPLVFILVLLGVLIIFGSHSVFAPLMYPFF